jgi:hypothetical protein
MMKVPQAHMGSVLGDGIARGPRGRAALIVRRMEVAEAR